MILRKGKDSTKFGRSTLAELRYSSFPDVPLETSCAQRAQSDSETEQEMGREREGGWEERRGAGGRR